MIYIFLGITIIAALMPDVAVHILKHSKIPLLAIPTGDV
jgi:hypothetical protein